MRKFFIIGLVLVIGGALVFFLTQKKSQVPRDMQEKKAIPMESITITTEDRFTIAGDYYPSKGKKGAVLLHMMPETKESWIDFAEKLSQADFHILAIDLRGHGKSTGGPGGSQSFTDAEHQKSVLDVEAAVTFLEGKGVGRNSITLIGASISANLALWYAVEHPEIKQIVLLSSGLNYRGIETLPLVQKFRDDQRVFFVSSEDDVRSGGNNAEMNRQLYEQVPPGVDKKLLVYQAAGHGTDMFGKEEPDLSQEIIGWIR